MGAWTNTVARATTYVIALGVCALLMACGGGGDSETSDVLTNTTVKSTPHTLAHVQLPVTEWTGDEGQHVVRDTTDWAHTWLKIQWLDGGAPTLTDIDFKQEMLVGVTSSYSACGGRIDILSAQLEPTPQGNAWVVEFQAQEHFPTDAVCPMEVVPIADFIRLPQNPLPVRFVELPRRP